MATNVGEVSIKLAFDTKQVSTDQDKTTKEVESKWKNVGTSLGNIAKNTGKVMAAGFATVGTAITAISKSAVESFADYEQLVGGVETLFKDSASVVENYANQAYKTAGLSANDYMETVTSFSASLLQSLGNDTAKAAEYGNQAVIDMSDNANKMGTSIESIQWAYQGFAKQNYTMLDNLKLGYGGTKTEMERLIADANKVKEANGEMADLSIESFADVTEAIHIIQTEMGITGTTAKEADATIQGSANSMKSAWQNMLTGLADPSQDFDQLVENLVDSVGTFANNLVPVLTNAMKGVGKLVGELAPIIVDQLPVLFEEVLPGLIDAAIDTVDSLVAMLPTLLPPILDGLVDIVNDIILQIPTILMHLINAIIAAVPTLLQGLVAIMPQIIQAVTTLVTSVASMLTQPSNMSLILNAALQLLMALVQALPQTIQSLAEALPQIIDNIITFLTDPNTISMLLDAAVQLFFALVQAVPQILGALLGAFGSLVGSLWNGITSMFSEFSANFGSFITDIFKGAINGILGFIERFLNSPIDILNGFIDIINGAFGAVGVNLSHIDRISLPRLAQGGLVSSATTAIIGEAGQEAVLPLERNTGNWSGLLADTLLDAMAERGGISETGGIIVNQTNYINNEMDADDIGRRMMTSIRRAAL